MNELLELNQRLSYLQGEFVNEVIKRGFWGPRAFLEENEITDLDEIIFLQKYLRHVSKQFRKVWMEEGYENYLIFGTLILSTNSSKSLTSLKFV